MPTLDFKGKQFIYSHHHSVPFRELLVNSKKSLPADGKKPSLDDNLIIHGDNLHALKALMPHYAGKINCIYIDPPYNTGNEGWCYNDNVNSPLMKEWLSKNANPVDKEDMQRHDKWLCMMYPRLKLLHELLADDGVIFVSIDDNEVHHLRAVMDEIWGENNFLTTLTIRANPRGRQSDLHFATLHDFCICYAKRKESTKLNGLPLSGEDIDEYNKQDVDGKKWRELGLRQRGAESLRQDREDMFFPIFVNPDTGDVSLEETNIFSIEVIPQKSDGRDGRWSWGAKKVKDDINRVYSRKVAGRNEFDIFIKDYLERNDVQKTSKPKTIWIDKEVNTESGGKLLKQIMEGKVFNYPKPFGLIRRILQIATDKNSIILDSFSGSGTTGHAVLDLNKEDGGNRKFILVEMEDYADSITAERVRRVITGLTNAKDEKLKAGLGGSFTFCELGKEISIEKIITGESLPDYPALAQYVFYTATGKSLDKEAKEKSDYFVGETDLYQVYLIYKPDIAFLRSNDSALNDDKLTAIAARNSKKEKLVFATAKYRGQKELSAQNITFCQLPYAIHRVVGA